MDMASAIPDWLTPVAWTYITLSLLSSALIAFDIYGRRRRQESVATELVWISAALYLGPFAVAAFLRQARGRSHSGAAEGALPGSAGPAVAALAGGGASAVAHLVAVPMVVAVGWTIAGMAMWPMIIVIAVFAVVMLVLYERAGDRRYATEHRGTPSVGAAVMAAGITVAAFDVGMVGWMLILHFNNAMPPVTEGTFWFLMQIGVVVGLLTGYPAVRWLLRRQHVAAPA